ncbi:MAG: ferredoxin [Gemmatimonadota bacterium]
MVRIKINKATCGRTGMCYLEFPDVLGEDDEGFPTALRSGLARAVAQRIVETCPTGSISFTEEAEPTPEPDR